MYTKFLLENLQKAAVQEPKRLRIVPVNDPLRISRELNLLHYPFFDFFFPTLKVPDGLAVVVTVHDAIPLRFPEHYPPGLKGTVNLWRQRQNLKRVSAVITDSLSSKHDLEAYLKIPDQKISVVPLGPQFPRLSRLNLREESKVREKYHLPPKYLLYVGDVDWSKNLSNLAAAAKMTGLPLVIGGQKAASPLRDNIQKYPSDWPFRDFLATYGMDPEIMRPGYIDPVDLPAVYHLATVYCQASWWEGFGLSALESLVAGCPVVASDTPALRELLGSAAIFVPPDRPASIAAGIKKAQAPQERQRLISAGRQRARLFSWQKSADAALEVYQKVILSTQGGLL